VLDNHRPDEIPMSTTNIDEAKVEAFMGQAVTDMGAAISAPLFLIGERLGLTRRWPAPGR
jgi:hypothetical protein